jgi:hypothetical protein
VVLLLRSLSSAHKENAAPEVSEPSARTMQSWRTSDVAIDVQEGGEALCAGEWRINNPVTILVPKLSSC